MRRVIAYSLVFAGAFLATVWLRSTESGAEPGTPRAAEEVSLRRHAVADPQGQTPPQARAAAPSAAAQVPAPQPIDDPRDAIAGDVYPVMQRSDASPSGSH